MPSGEPLRGHVIDGVDDAWAAGLLRSLGASVPCSPAPGDADAAWAASGAMAVSGAPDGPPPLAPGRPALAAAGAAAALERLAPLVFGTSSAALDGAGLLGERAALSGRRPAAPWNLGRTCRALRCDDGWVALNLARQDDIACVAALFEVDEVSATAERAWALAASLAAHRTVGELTARSRLLALPLVAIPSAPPPATPWRLTRLAGPAGPPAPSRTVRVVDLSTLWAGPLAGSLLGHCGAEVVRVESTRRPDGSREGVAGFDDLLHGGQPSLSLDLTSPVERLRMREIVDDADVVITSARSRALERLGLDPRRPARRRQVRVAVTAHGLADDRVGFGDDAAMAGGLYARLDDTAGTPVPVADAVADPLTGVHAAAAALGALLGGGSWLVDIALSQVSAAVAGPAGAAGPAGPAGSAGSAGSAGPAGPAGDAARVHRHGAGWCVVSRSGHTPVAPPRARRPLATARPLGADNHRG